MRRLLPLIVISLLLVLPVAAQGAPPKPRPYGGCGVLAVRPEPGGRRSLLVLYQEPGLQRVAELEPGALPRLAGSAAQPLLAVSERRGGWSRLAYDDAGREGWLEEARSWRYLSWRDFLPGRPVRILPGLKKGFYALRSEPGAQAPEVGSVSRDQELRVLRVEGDWARLQGLPGWFRWLDGDGRLTVSLPGGDESEK